MIYIVCTAILVLLYFALSLNVSMARRATQTSFGPGSDPNGRLNKAIRAHGNAAEYVPIFIALLLYFALVNAGTAIAVIAIIVTVSRILHAIGMLASRSSKGPPHPLRAVGALGTYVGGFALGVALLLRVLL